MRFNPPIPDELANPEGPEELADAVGLGGPPDAGGPDELADPARSDEPRLPTLLEVMGGPWGMAESSLPPLVFVIAFTANGRDVTGAAKIAVVVGIVLTIVRLARRESPRQSLTGLAGVLIAAFFAARTGRAENYFVPGFFINAAYMSGMLISIVARWPAIGVIVGQFDGTGMAFRDDPVRMRLMVRMTLMWAAMFGVRLAVQLPMYFAGAVVALGVARTLMGYPLIGLVAWLTYRWARLAPPVDEEDSDDVMLGDG